MEHLETYIILPQGAEGEVVQATTKTDIVRYVQRKYEGQGFILIGPVQITQLSTNVAQN